MEPGHKRTECKAEVQPEPEESSESESDQSDDDGEKEPNPEATEKADSSDPNAPSEKTASVTTGQNVRVSGQARQQPIDNYL